MLNHGTKLLKGEQGATCWSFKSSEIRGACRQGKVREQKCQRQGGRSGSPLPGSGPSTSSLWRHEHGLPLKIILPRESKWRSVERFLQFSILRSTLIGTGGYPALLNLNLYFFFHPIIMQQADPLCRIMVFILSLPLKVKSVKLEIYWSGKRPVLDPGNTSQYSLQCTAFTASNSNRA